MKIQLAIPVSFFALLLAAPSLQAQQPGSAAYNSVYLPAHGVGDTAPARVRWGALALGDGQGIGWVLGTDSEKVAADGAVEACRQTGGRSCEIKVTFYNSCAAVARGAEYTAWSYSSTKSMKKIRKKAIRNCGGADCSIIREGCTSGYR